MVEGATATGCTQVNSYSDIQNIIETSLPSRIAIFCPFSVTKGEDESTIVLSDQHKNIKLLCFKSNAEDRCIIGGGSRHMEIMGDGVTVMGFTFIGATNGSVSVTRGKGVSFIECDFLE